MVVLVIADDEELGVADQFVKVAALIRSLDVFHAGPQHFQHVLLALQLSLLVGLVLLCF